MIDFPAELRLILVDLHKTLCLAWHEAFAAYPNVEVVCGRFQDLPEFDCLVSPGNSFGLMDGGVDKAIVDYYGPALQARVRQDIFNQYLGEQPVGTSLIVETGNPKHPYLAHTPTMRVPQAICGTDYVYLAMRAMLLAIRAHNAEIAMLSAIADRIAPGISEIRSVSCPGLGTGTGKVVPAAAAAQMALAYASTLPKAGDGGHEQYPGWPEALRRQRAIKRACRGVNDACEFSR